MNTISLYKNSLSLFRVIQSSNDKFEVGDFVLASCGWVDHFICDDNTNLPFGPVTKVSLPRNLLSHALGLLGVTGFVIYMFYFRATAFFLATVNNHKLCSFYVLKEFN